MKTWMWVAGAPVWALLVFVVTLFVTFPSQVVADRIRYEVPNFLGRDYSADVGSVRPWWVGLTVRDMKLYKQGGAARSDEEEDSGGAQLVALLSKVSMRVSPWSLLRRAPYVSGSVKLTDGQVDYAVGTAMEQRGGDVILADLVLASEDMPLADLFMLVPGLTATGVGAVDLQLDLHAGENGMRDASGTFSFGGEQLVLSDIELPMMGALGMDVPISELVLTADVADGIATVTGGKLLSDLATVEITGTMTLRDPIDRSAVDLQIALSNLGEALKPYEGFMSQAKQEDGTYRYSCRGVVSRLSANSCTIGTHERRVTSSRSPSSSSGSPGVSGTMPPRSTSSRDAETDEERERRRDEIRERIRQKREERDAARNGAVPAHDPPADEEDEGGDEELTVEEHGEDEELPEELPEGEEPLE